MNTTQVKCFLAVADTLNFTKAADQLFMSQPGISRQIVTLERELNTLLFIRDKHKVRLTPAGALLAKELASFQTSIDAVLVRVKNIGEGYKGTLSIGVLDGQWMGEDLTNKCIQFINQNSNIDLIFKQGSFSDLRKWLITGDVDLAITLKFDIKNNDEILYENYEKDKAVFAISKHTVLGKKKKISFDDLSDYSFISIAPEDSQAGAELCKMFFKKAGVNINKIKYAPNLATVMMWTEAAQGFAIINHRSSIVANSSIRIIDELTIDDDEASNCIAWKKSNLNPAISMFVNYLTH